MLVFFLAVSSKCLHGFIYPIIRTWASWHTQWIYCTLVSLTQNLTSQDPPRKTIIMHQVRTNGIQSNLLIKIIITRWAMAGQLFDIKGGWKIDSGYSPNTSARLLTSYIISCSLQFNQNYMTSDSFTQNKWTIHCSQLLKIATCKSNEQPLHNKL